MVYKECGTSCERSCSNQELIACDQSCIMGCFCPNDTVYDDVKETGCIQASECYCKYSGQIYPPGSFINTPCQNCDHGEVCQNSLFTVHGEFKSCNQNEGETCLTKVVLSLDDTNTLFMLIIYIYLKLSSIYTDNVTVFQPTTFYIIVDTYLGLRLDIQLIPIMQVYINLNTTYSDLTCGLCGNYNSKQQDDFTTPDGMIVQDLSIFTYSWRSLQTCPHVPVVITDPCTNNFMNATYAEDCDSSMRYQELVASCQPTCKSLSHHDPSCSVNFIPIDGCVCKKDTYLTEDGNCVTMKRCPCYYMGDYINPGEETSKNGIICTCINGKLECEAEQETKDCTSPMTYFNCSVVPEGATGIECLKSCQNQDVPCYSTDCISGCVCPTDMLADGKGGCVTSDTCTCIHNDIIYDHKQSTRIGCSMCTCNNQKWDCENNDIMAECTVYGEGNYITFDQKQYRYNGQCQYTLVQDYCGYNVLNGTFRIMSENTKCGTSGTTCSKSITVLINDFRLVLSDGNMQLTNFGDQLDSPFQIRNSSIYLIIKVSNGIVLTWDKKTSIIIKVTPSFQNKLCGLCGNYDGNSLNDFNTRGHFQVADLIEFGNSWKLYPTCPEITSIPEPCEMNPFRKTWAQRKCSIILSEVFQPCHAQVDPSSYYDACVKDSCGCNEGGDCDCFCTAVAMYAQACLAQCVCVEWRNPNLCPVFCDYYNREGNCEWHYRACGPNCMKTCQNPSGICSPELFKVEGCYPTCPDNKPYFEETGMSCVEVCGCYDQKGKYYHPGEIVLSCNNCESCHCGMGTIDCKYDLYVSPAISCTPEVCTWSDWIDSSTPTTDKYGGDYETIEAIRLKGYKICDEPRDIRCQTVAFPSTPAEMGQIAICSPKIGLICHNEKQTYGQCFDYKIKVLCCTPGTCNATTTMGRTSSQPSVTSKPASAVTRTLSTSVKHTSGTAITKCACTSDGKLYPPVYHLKPESTDFWKLHTRDTISLSTKISTSTVLTTTPTPRKTSVSTVSTTTKHTTHVSISATTFGKTSVSTIHTTKTVAGTSTIKSATTPRITTASTKTATTPIMTKSTTPMSKRTTTTEKTSLISKSTTKPITKTIALTSTLKSASTERKTSASTKTSATLPTMTKSSPKTTTKPITKTTASTSTIKSVTTPRKTSASTTTLATPPTVTRSTTAVSVRTTISGKTSVSPKTTTKPTTKTLAVTSTFRSATTPRKTSASTKTSTVTHPTVTKSTFPLSVSTTSTRKTSVSTKVTTRPTTKSLAVTSTIKTATTAGKTSASTKTSTVTHPTVTKSTSPLSVSATSTRKTSVSTKGTTRPTTKTLAVTSTIKTATTPGKTSASTKTSTVTHPTVTKSTIPFSVSATSTRKTSVSTKVTTRPTTKTLAVTSTIKTATTAGKTSASTKTSTVTHPTVTKSATPLSVSATSTKKTSVSTKVTTRPTTKSLAVTSTIKTATTAGKTSASTKTSTVTHPTVTKSATPLSVSATSTKKTSVSTKVTTRPTTKSLAVTSTIKTATTAGKTSASTKTSTVTHPTVTKSATPLSVSATSTKKTSVSTKVTTRPTTKSLAVTSTIKTATTPGKTSASTKTSTVTHPTVTKSATPLSVSATSTKKTSISTKVTTRPTTKTLAITSTFKSATTPRKSSASTKETSVTLPTMTKSTTPVSLKTTTSGKTSVSSKTTTKPTTKTVAVTSTFRSATTPGKTSASTKFSTVIHTTVTKSTSPLSVSATSTRKTSVSTKVTTRPTTKTLAVTSTIKTATTPRKTSASTQTPRTSLTMSKSSTILSASPKSTTKPTTKTIALTSISTKAITESKTSVSTKPVITTSHSTLAVTSPVKSQVPTSALTMTPSARASTLLSKTTEFLRDQNLTTSQKSSVISDCFNASCSTTGAITVNFMNCKAQTKITCESNLEPQRIYDEKGCCFRFQCPPCLGPDAIARPPGSIWTQNCKNCFCDPYNLTITCSPVTCDSVNVKCDIPGYEPVQTVSADPCCPYTQCCEYNILIFSWLLTNTV
eukprot:XP_017948647.1 PREDICTED: mucin-2 [Xenopus tropicalis]